MYRVLGIDPGSKSWDFFGLEDNKIILDTSLPTKELINDPQKAITIINSAEDVDLMVAPSGFGLPLKDVHELTEQDIFFTLLKFDQQEKNKLVGLGEVLRLIKAQNIPGIIVPGVKHLPTVPKYRKINKIDMGTADKICTAVTGIRDQMERFKVGAEETNFIMVEIGAPLGEHPVAELQCRPRRESPSLQGLLEQHMIGSFRTRRQSRNGGRWLRRQNRLPGAAHHSHKTDRGQPDDGLKLFHQSRPRPPS